MTTTTTSYRSVVGLPPSPLLLALLQNTPPADVHGPELIDRMTAIRRLRNHCEALMVLHIAELAQRRPADPSAPMDPFHIQEVEKYCVDEISLALKMSKLTARGHLDTATLLHDRLPTVIDALKAGYIDLWSARTILDETLHLTEAEAAQVADEVLQTAADKTLGEIRALARRLALRIKPKEPAVWPCGSSRKKPRKPRGSERRTHAGSGCTTPETATPNSLPPSPPPKAR